MDPVSLKQGPRNRLAICVSTRYEQRLMLWINLVPKNTGTLSWV